MLTLQRLRWSSDLAVETAAPVAVAFDAIAPRYDSAFLSARCRIEDRQLAARLRRFLNDVTGNVLDVGCGTGALLRLKVWPAVRYTGLDVSAGMIAEAKARYPRAEFIQASVESAPLPDAAYDAVISTFAALSYVSAPARAMTEIHRVLRPGGRCFVMAYTPRWYRHNVETMGQVNVSLAPAAWTAWQAVTRFRQAGFDPASIRLSAFSILPTPLMKLDALIARRLPQSGRYLIIEATRP